MPIQGGIFTNQREAEYAGLPVEQIEALNKDSSERYANAYQSKNLLDTMYNSIDTMDVDAPYKKELIDKYKADIEGLVQRGDYQNAGYLVSNLTNKLKNNQKLAGVMERRQREMQELQSLNERLQGRRNLKDGKIEKVPTIDPDDYERAVYLNKQNNSQPSEYDEETMRIKNPYQATQILDSKAQEIYDNGYKRIEGWKEGTLMINGQPYTKTYKDGKGYIVNEKGVGVELPEVYKALETEIKNNPQYMAYINQKKDTEMFKRFGKGTSSERPVTGIDLVKHFDLSENEQKMIATEGKVSQSKLDELASKTYIDENGKKVLKSKEQLAEDSKAYDLMKKEYDLANINSLDSNQLKNLYENILIQEKVKDFVVPPAEKASYQKFDETWREDKYSLMNHEYELKKKLAKFEEDVKNPVIANPENKSVAETYEYNQLENTFANLADIKGKMLAIEQKYGHKDPMKMSKDDANTYNDLSADKQMHELAKSKAYDLMKSKGVDVVKETKDFMFNTNSVAMNQLEMLKAFIKTTPELSANLEQFITNREELELALQVKDITSKNFSNNMDNVKKTLEVFNKLVSNNPTLSKKLDIFIEEATLNYKSGIKPHNRGVGEQLTSNKGRNDLTENNEYLRGIAQIGEFVERKEEKFFEESSNNLYQLDTNVISTDEKGSKEGKADLTNQYVHQWNQLVKAGTDMKTMSGLSLQDIVKEYNENLSDGQGDKNKIKVEDLTADLATKRINGKFALVVRLPDGNNKIVFPANQDELKRTLTDIGTLYNESGKDETTKEKGREMLSQANFGYLKTIIPDAHINNRNIGTILPIDIPMNNKNVVDSKGTKQKFGIKITEKLADGTSIFKVVDSTGNTSAFDILFSKINGQNNFRSIDDLMYNLQVVELSK